MIAIGIATCLSEIVIKIIVVTLICLIITSFVCGLVCWYPRNVKKQPKTLQRGEKVQMRKAKLCCGDFRGFLETCICNPCLLADASYHSNLCNPCGSPCMNWSMWLCVYSSCGGLWFCQCCVVPFLRVKYARNAKSLGCKDVCASICCGFCLVKQTRDDILRHISRGNVSLVGNSIEVAVCPAANEDSRIVPLPASPNGSSRIQVVRLEV